MNDKVRVYNDSLKRGNGLAFFCSVLIAGSGFFLLWLYSKVTKNIFRFLRKNKLTLTFNILY